MITATDTEKMPRKPRPFGRKAMIVVSHPDDNYRDIYFRILAPTDTLTYGDVREIVRRIDKRLKTIPAPYHDQLFCEIVVGYTGYHVTYNALAGLRKLAAEGNPDSSSITPLWLGFFLGDENIKNRDAVIEGMLRSVA